MEFVQSSQGLLVWSVAYLIQWCGMWFIQLSGVIKNSHCSVGLSRIHNIQCGSLEFPLFSGVIWSSHCSVGLYGVHIVQWGYQEFA